MSESTISSFLTPLTHPSNPLLSYWSKLTTDGTLTWGPDPLLTSLGITQAQEAGRALAREREAGLGVPEVSYLSPLRRAVDTWREVFGVGRGEGA